MTTRRSGRVVMGIVGAVLVSGLLSAPALAATATASVKIQDNCGAQTFCYNPAKLTVAPGTLVKWPNQSVAGHTVTRCTVDACGVGGGTGSDNGPRSDIIAPGDKYKFTFNGKGSYVYYCVLHGYASMHGKVIVG